MIMRVIKNVNFAFAPNVELQNAIYLFGGHNGRQGCTFEGLK